MTKIFFEIVGAFVGNANEAVFIEVFGSEKVGKHLYSKFVNDFDHNVLFFSLFLSIENRKLLNAYLDVLIAEGIKEDHHRRNEIRAAYERDEKERTEVLASLQHEANRALEIQKAYEQLPEKARSFITQ